MQYDCSVALQLTGTGHMLGPCPTPPTPNGHDDGVLRSHRWRTAANSAAYLLAHLGPGLDVLDVGCGPGTITCDLVPIVAPGRVVGIDASAAVVDEARAAAAAAAVAGVAFEVATCSHCPSPTTRSTWSTPTRCCSTWPTRSGHSSRWPGSAGPAASWRPGTACIRRSATRPPTRTSPGPSPPTASSPG